MPHHHPHALGRALEGLSGAVTRFAGSSWGFGLATLTVIVWGATGPLFHYSNTWQLVINTGTTIVTFLMVFLIQRSQNKESIAMQLKLSELIASQQGASNRMVVVEDLEEDELRTLREYYTHLSRIAREDTKLTQSHSIAEAEETHLEKEGRDELTPQWCASFPQA